MTITGHCSFALIVSDLLAHVGLDVPPVHVADWDPGQVHKAVTFAVETALARTPDRPRPIRMPRFLRSYPTKHHVKAEPSNER